MFMIRTAFWLSVVVMLLPADNTEKVDPTLGAAKPVSAVKALDAARTTVSDVSGFCDRNRSVCDTGEQAFAVFVHKAKYGAQLIYDWASENGSPTNPAQLTAIDPVIVTGSAKPMRLAGVHKPKTGSTLTKEDLIPVWGGPMRRSKA